MASNKAIDQYSLEFETFAGGPGGLPVRAVATNRRDESFAETWLTLESTRSILLSVHPGERAIVDEYMGQLRDHNSIKLHADSKSPAIFTSRELVTFGFNPDDLKF